MQRGQPWQSWGSAEWSDQDWHRSSWREDQWQSPHRKDYPVIPTPGNFKEDESITMTPTSWGTCRSTSTSKRQHGAGPKASPAWTSNVSRYHTCAIIVLENLAFDPSATASSRCCTHQDHSRVGAPLTDLRATPGPQCGHARTTRLYLTRSTRLPSTSSQAAKPSLKYRTRRSSTSRNSRKQAST